MPILAAAALKLEGATPFLAGLAVGSYALMQMIFQYPFGMLSDRFGRKRMIAAGMIIFAAGSIICAQSTDIWFLIIGRFVQGMGVVTSVITAGISDLTSEDQRSKAMAFMGVSIACSFTAAIPLSPVIGGAFGVESLFWISACLVIPTIFLLIFAVKTPPKIHPLEPIVGSKLKRVFADSDLMRLNCAMFLHSFVMTSSFVMIPLALTRELGYEIGCMWRIYLPALACGVLAMGLGTAIGEKKNAVKKVMLFGITALICAYAGLLLSGILLIPWVMLIFAGLNSLEPLMQSSASKLARSDVRGAALGLFNAFQFCGVFAGGVGAGVAYDRMGAAGIAAVLLVVSSIWFIITLRLKNPVKTVTIRVEFDTARTQKEIEEINGVIEAYRSEKLYIRYDPAVIDGDTLRGRL
jgi:predicted MFS family arabinose efflux permease